MPPPAVSTSILEIKTDVATALATLAQVDKRLDALGPTSDRTGKRVSGALEQAFKGLTGVDASLAGIGTALVAAFSVTAVVAMGKQVLDYAGHVSDLSARLGISTDAVQHWESAFGPAGVAIDTVAKSANVFAEKVAGNDKSAVATLKALGVSVSDLKKLTPEQQFNVAADAVGRLTDQGERVLAAKSLFGKGGVEMLATLDGHLQENIASFDALGLTIDEKTIKAADDFGDQLGLMGKQLLGIVATLIGPLLPALSSLGNILMWIAANVIQPVFNVVIKVAMTLIAGLVEVVTGALARLYRLASNLPGVGTFYGQMADKMEAASKDASQYVADLWKNTDQTGASSDKAKPKVIGLGAALEDGGKSAKKSTDEHAKLVKQINTLTRSGYDDAAAMRIMAGEIEGVGTKTDDIDKLKAKFKEVGDVIRTSILTIGEIRIPVTVGLEGWEAKNKLPDLLPAGVMPQFLTQLPGEQDGIESGSRFMRGFNTSVSDVLRGFPQLLQSAFTGGGGMSGAFKALASDLGSSLFGEHGPLGFGAGGLFNGVGNKLAGVFGSAVGLALPGIGGALGSLIGPLVGKIGGALKNLFGGPSQAELAGRDVEAKFEGQFKSFDAMVTSVADAYIATGKTADEARADVEALMAAEKEGPEAAQQWVDKIQGTLDQHQQVLDAVRAAGFESKTELQDALFQAQSVLDYMQRSGEYTADQLQQAFGNVQDAAAAAGDTAAAAWVQARDAAAEQFAQAGKDLEDLIGQRNSLMQSVSAEAPEATMGVIESQQRGQLAVLDDQIADKADAYAQLAKDTGQSMSEEITKALSDMDIPPVTIPIHWDAPPLPTGAAPPVIPMADGGIGRALGPTFFYSAGDEDFAFSGEGRGFGSTGSTGGPRVLQLVLNGRVLAQAMEDEQGADYRLRHKVTR